MVGTDALVGNSYFEEEEEEEEEEDEDDTEDGEAGDARQLRHHLRPFQGYFARVSRPYTPPPPRACDVFYFVPMLIGCGLVLAIRWHSRFTSLQTPATQAPLALYEDGSEEIVDFDPKPKRPARPGGMYS